MSDTVFETTIALIVAVVALLSFLFGVRSGRNWESWDRAEAACVEKCKPRAVVYADAGCGCVESKP